ncbi:porin family protein [Mesorhizobium sp. B3-1-3]|uniref:outer membrane protein n=1 Tax=unclassified Mesorhizobium TaxID=325217 RepID=UPI0011293856|nr:MULTISPECIES: outer membrane beta-barrel protein [unclassified Mesorhizobium]TPI65523.1 porin family protein [Mesorhizobium sp. B3-1-8]TPI72718.1 porin family protein [Mesorhizobium sp. B3-1-3]
MRKLLATTALVLFSATTGYAADMAGPVAGSVYDWSGFYAGAHIGVATGNIGATDFTQPSGGFFTELVPAGTEGFHFRDTNIAGGVHVGAQYQWDQFVFGGEASWTATGIRKTIVSPYFPDTDTETGRIQHYATVVGKVGYAFDRFLVYAKGGYAGGEVGFKARDNDALVTYEQNEWHNGYALGLGVDYALTDKLSLGIDYTHIDLGSKTSTGNNVFDDGSLGDNPETYKVKARADAVMARLSYKFGGGF